MTISKNQKNPKKTKKTQKKPMPIDHPKTKKNQKNPKKTKKNQCQFDNFQKPKKTKKNQKKPMPNLSFEGSVWFFLGFLPPLFVGKYHFKQKTTSSQSIMQVFTNDVFAMN